MQQEKDTKHWRLIAGKRLYPSAFGCVLLYVLGFFFTPLYTIATICLAAIVTLTLTEYFILFMMSKPPVVVRHTPEKLSNGDKNPILIQLRSRMLFRVHVTVYDEIPAIFQARDFHLKTILIPGKTRQLTYYLTPQNRGSYTFGNIRLFMSTSLGFVQRYHVIPQVTHVPVYPSFLHMRKYRLVADGRLPESGGRRMRKIGHSMEFEQIKEYVRGDDVRTINWKATARKGSLMVNHYVDEKAQQVYCIIDKGRLMKSPFNGITLLDYAINSALVIADVSLRKQDKAGLITFADEVDGMLLADRRPVQSGRIMDMLYKLETTFPESNFEQLYMQVRARIQQRSFLIVYTNFESMSGLKRQLKSLVSLAKHHLLLVVIFENSELVQLSKTKAETVEDIYIRTIADKFTYEKKMIVKELNTFGIHTLLVQPEQVSIQMLNKYLEFKNRHAV